MSVSYPVLQLACNVSELIAHIRQAKTAPMLNRYRFKFLACHLDYSIARARDELGYTPVVQPETGLPASVRWLLEHRRDLFRQPPRETGPFEALLPGDPEVARRNQAFLARLEG